MADPLIEQALTRRAPLFTSAETDAFRVLHRAADGLPQLAVDRFADVLVAHLYDDQAPLARVEALARRVGARSLYVKRRPAQASVLSATDRAALAPAAPHWGAVCESVVVRENGLRYLIRPGAGLSVGLFLDMRETRAWVRAQAAGRTILNCFAYTCGFGVAAAAGGAARVVNLDLARAYLEWGQANYQLNGLAPAPRDFIFGDALDWLGRLARRGERFDLVILDPPSYATSKRGRFTVQRDYADLARRAAQVVTPGGWLIACANAAELSVRAFHQQLRAGLDGLPARITHTTHEPELDFPVTRGETPYLKVAFVRLAA